jgi:hypothetical protein
MKVFYGELEKIQLSLNSKIGLVSNIQLKVNYSNFHADMKLVFVEDENKEVKLASMSIKPQLPFKSDSLNKL